MRTSVFAVLLGGCVIDPSLTPNPDDEPVSGEGIVEVTWAVGSAGCDAAGVSDVQVLIGPLDETARCTDGSMRLQLPPDDYELVAIGLDVDGIARFQATDRSVSVFENETTIVPTLRLSAIPAKLSLFWRFDNGSLCAANGVSEIDIALFDNEQIINDFPVVVDCGPGLTEFDDIPAGTYDVSMFGLDPEGTAIFEATDEITLLRGEAASFELELESIDPISAP